MKSEKNRKFKNSHLKRCISILTTTILIFITVFCYNLNCYSDEAASIDGFSCYIDKDAKTARISYITKKDENVIIPSILKYNGKNYKVIDVQFFTIKYAKTIHLDSKLYIGSQGKEYPNNFALNSIKDCPELEYIFNTNSLTGFAGYLFYNCPNIKEVYFPNFGVIKEGLRSYARFEKNSCVNAKTVYLGDLITIFRKINADPETNKITAYIPISCNKIQTVPECFEKIYGQTGSYAEEFANENGIEFIPVKEGYIRGDFNYDGEVNIADVTETQRYLAGLSTIDHVDEQVAYWQGNFDADNHFDVKDVTYLQKYLAEYELYLNGTEKYVNGVRQ